MTGELTAAEQSAGVTPAGSGLGDAEAAAGSALRRWNWRTVGLVSASALVLVGLFYNLARRVFGGDSDSATLVLQGQTVNSGNVTLHGWQLVYDSFWTIEVPFYALGVRLFGPTATLTFLVPAVIATLVVLVGCWLARENLRGSAAWVAGVTTFAVLALPTGAWAVLFLRPGWHAGTTLWCLIAFAAIRRGRWGVGWWVAVLFLAAGLNGDLQTLAYGVGAVFGAGLVSMLRRRSVRAGLPTVSAAVGGVVLGIGVRWLAQAIGTYTIGPGNRHAPLAQIKLNVLRLPSWAATAFGADDGPFGDLGTPAALQAVRMVAFGVAALGLAVAVVVGLRDALWGRQAGEAGTGQSWRLDDLLVMGCVADMIFFSYATMSTDQSYLRYLIPLVIFGSVLAGRFVGRITGRVVPRLGRPARFGVATAGLAVLASFLAATAVRSVRAKPALTASDLAGFLDAHGLRVGIGSYWDASVTTVASGGRWWFDR